jgi:hypothetical protein
MVDEQKLGVTEVLGEHATNPETVRTTGWPLHGAGRDWTVSSMENRIKAQIEQLVRRKALELIRITDQDDPSSADALREKFSDDFTAGLYNYPDSDGLEGSHVRKFMFSRSGVPYVMHLLLLRCHKDITREQVLAIAKECPKEFIQAYKWALGNLLAPQASVEQEEQTSQGASQTSETIHLSQKEIDMVKGMRKINEPPTMK